MRKLELVNGKKSCVLIKREIARSDESRYDHRLHAVLMVGQGMSCAAVAGWFEQDQRTIERWIRRFNLQGLDGLREGEHSGRRTRLTETQWADVGIALRTDPRELGYNQNLWDGKLLSHHLAEHHDVILGVRECQRIFHRLEFRNRKPRPVIAEGDPVAQAAYKKTDIVEP